MPLATPKKHIHNALTAHSGAIRNSTLTSTAQNSAKQPTLSNQKTSAAHAPHMVATVNYLSA